MNALLVIEPVAITKTRDNYTAYDKSQQLVVTPVIYCPLCFGRFLQIPAVFYKLHH